MAELPESLRTDIALSLFEIFIKSSLFPDNEPGAILAIVRRCKVQMCCAGEFVMIEGELGLEMYFIIDGFVEIV